MKRLQREMQQYSFEKYIDEFTDALDAHERHVIGLQVSAARHGVAMATGDSTSLPAVAKQQRQCSDRRGSAWFASESDSLYLAGSLLYLTLSSIRLSVMKLRRLGSMLTFSNV